MRAPAPPSGPLAAWIIALREVTEHLVSARFLVIALLVIGLTPLAVFVGAGDYASRSEEYSRLVAERQERVAGLQDERVFGTPDHPSNLALRAVRAPEPLGVLARGLDGALPTYWDFSPTGLQEGPAAARAQRLADMFGHLDLAFLIVVVLGLLAILLAFDAVAGEKELGTLRAVLSHSVSRSAFVAGKLLGGAVTLLVPLLATVLLALLSARLFGVDLLGMDALAKVALLTAGSAIYLVCLYAAGLLVSSLFASQKTALVVLLVGWVIAVLALPPLSTLVAQAAVPLPSYLAVETQRRGVERDLRTDMASAGGAVYREVGGQPERTVNTAVYRNNKEEMDARLIPVLVGYVNERNRLLGEIERDVQRRQARQNAVARVITALSPSAAFASAAADLAGTGDARYGAWLDAARRHQSRLSEVLFESPPLVPIDNVGASFSAQLRDPPTLAELPAFTPPRRDAAASVSRSLGRLGLLLLYTGLFVAGAFVAFSRYDVR